MTKYDTILNLYAFHMFFYVKCKYIEFIPFQSMRFRCVCYVCDVSSQDILYFYILLFYKCKRRKLFTWSVATTFLKYPFIYFFLLYFFYFSRYIYLSFETQNKLYAITITYSYARNGSRSGSSFLFFRITFIFFFIFWIIVL